MKTLSLLLVMLFLVITTTPIYAATNPTVLEQVSATAKQTVATNINQIMLQILTGVKDASGEIYGVSKVAVAQSYDYIKKETPEVIKEFLRWRLVEASIYTFGWIAGACLLFFFSAKMAKCIPNIDDDENKEVVTFFKWVMIVVASFMIVFTICINGMSIGKIVVAPRVYIIEYVVNTIQAHK